MGQFMDKAVAGWGAPLPDWIEVLANECDRSSQNGVAKRLKYSATVVHMTLINRYTGDMRNFEATVRFVLMREVIDCPKLGEIVPELCKDWQAKARAFSSHNLERVQMARACRKCGHFKEE